MMHETIDDVDERRNQTHYIELCQRLCRPVYSLRLYVLVINRPKTNRIEQYQRLSLFLLSIAVIIFQFKK